MSSWQFSPKDHACRDIHPSFGRNSPPPTIHPLHPRLTFSQQINKGQNSRARFGCLKAQRCAAAAAASCSGGQSRGSDFWTWVALLVEGSLFWGMCFGMWDGSKLLWGCLKGKPRANKRRLGAPSSCSEIGCCNSRQLTAAYNPVGAHLVTIITSSQHCPTGDDPPETQNQIVRPRPCLQEAQKGFGE